MLYLIIIVIIFFLNIADNVPPYSYHSQEIAISTKHTRISPSSNEAGIEFKTFQQSPPKEDFLHHYMSNRDCNSPSHHANLYQPNVVTIQVCIF